MISLLRDPIGFYERLAKEQGDVAQFRLGWRRVVLLNRAELVHELLTRRGESFGRGYSITRAKIVLGDGLLTSTGERHAHQRRATQPAFRSRRLQRHAATMTSFTRDATRDWRSGDARDVQKDMTRLTQRIVAKCFFEEDLEGADLARLSDSLAGVVRGFGVLMAPFPASFLRAPLPPFSRLRASRDALGELIVRLIEARRDEGDRGDLLSMLLSSRDPGGRPLPVTQVRDEAINIFVAGYDTLANALSWTWFLLSSHADAEAQLHEELSRVLSHRPPNAADLPSLSFTRKVLAESMRMFPPVWGMGRRVARDTRIGGLNLRRGAMVQVCPWLLHRQARYFPSPSEFVPARWSQEFEKGLPKGAYVPFGLGSRMCIGRQFAWMAGTLILASVGQRWRLRPPVAAGRVEAQATITLRPRGGLVLRPELRSG